jgi:AP-3 complex subunit sigma
VDIIEKLFKSACELDIMNNPHKINMIIDEIIMGGIVIEPNI